MKKVTDTDRALVNVSRDGKTFFIWHKCRGRGKANPPIMCKKNEVLGILMTLFKEAGKLNDDVICDDLTSEDALWAISMELETLNKRLKGCCKK